MMVPKLHKPDRDNILVTGENPPGEKLGVTRPVYKFRRVCFCNSAEKWSWNIKMIVAKLYKA